jgi:hypothetical protein
MRRVVFLVLFMSLLTGRLVTGDQPISEDELTKLKREYTDVFALQGTSKAEILAIARILHAKPEIAIDQTASGGFREAGVTVGVAYIHRERSAAPSDSYGRSWFGYDENGFAMGCCHTSSDIEHRSCHANHERLGRLLSPHRF